VDAPYSAQVFLAERVVGEDRDEDLFFAPDYGGDDSALPVYDYADLAVYLS
jgi:hypothetical protein